jgi:FKBP-type peptidyl-prolyl cis-trans isomerase 2
MVLKKKDFIEIEFTGKIKDGGVFDSTKKEELKKSGIQGNPKPFVYSLGEGMFLEALDNYLIGKEVGNYTIELKPEEAFGKRDPKMLQMIPLKVFYEHQIRPIPGTSFNFDGKIAKVLTVSGGRVMVDFNNPLAGKEVIYDIEIKKKIEDINSKVDALNDFFFRKTMDYKIADKKLIMSVEKKLKKYAEVFKEKYKEILDLDLEVVEEVKKDSSEEKKKEEEK